MVSAHEYCEKIRGGLPTPSLFEIVCFLFSFLLIFYFLSSEYASFLTLLFLPSLSPLSQASGCIGSLSVDPNRVLDVLLDVLEVVVSHSCYLKCRVINA